MNLSRHCFKIVLGCYLAGVACADPLPIPPLPPPLKVYKPATGVTQGSGAAALAVVPPKPTTIRLTWDYAKLPYITFNVYHSNMPSFSSMVLLTNVSTNFFSKPADQPREFFGVKAYDTYLKTESTWATK